MSDPADLELGLRRRDAIRYSVELVFSQPGSEANVRPLSQRVATVSFDVDALLACALDPVAYGRALGRMLFGDAELATAFAQCRAVAQSQQRSLRLRLAIAADAPELHELRWETLRDPRDDLALAQSEQVIFTRTLDSADWQPITLRAESELRALAVIAGPADLGRYNLAPIDGPAEQARALASLAGIPTTVLSAPGQASLPTLVTQLRDGYDILYLVAHGMLDDEPWLFLDDGQGRAARVEGAKFLQLLTDLPNRPRLVLLASCMSAGDNSRSALTALGPRLAAAGIPAVIAMQGELSVATNAEFAPTFFRELKRDGRIDRALAVARQASAHCPDWWVPVLFTRLRSGRIWYTPGFDRQDFHKWPALITSVMNGRCTPILGPGLLDHYIGSTRDLAQRLAARHRFPLAPFARDDLPQVAQYLAVQQDIDFLRDELARTFHETLSALANEAAVPRLSPDDHLAAVGAQRRSSDPYEPHRVLARLPFRLYLSANADRLLSDALREAGKAPQSLICAWNRHGELRQTRIESLTVDQPLIYHLFGRLDDPESLVITEDDYFRFLIGVTRNEDLLPSDVNRALVDTALLFLGFRLDDWNFRVLFQSIVNLAGSERRRRYTHVAVQIDLQEGAMLDPAAAREYLKTYFGQASALSYQTTISIFWGSAEDFIRKLADEYDTQQRNG